ncbi:MAG: hypothetical protein HGB18_05005 [Candidatus Moranbacteria bacterium]|nr:hypothetical protein [Candidatus Moranbacteria bacterium]
MIAPQQPITARIGTPLEQIKPGHLSAPCQRLALSTFPDEVASLIKLSDNQEILLVRFVLLPAGIATGKAASDVPQKNIYFEIIGFSAPSQENPEVTLPIGRYHIKYAFVDRKTVYLVLRKEDGTILLRTLGRGARLQHAPGVIAENPKDYWYIVGFDNDPAIEGIVPIEPD